MSERDPEQIDNIISRYTEEVLEPLLDELEEDEIDEEEWEGDTKRALLDLYIILIIFFLGAVEPVTNEIRSRVDEAIQIQYGYLHRLAAGLAAGIVSIAEARRRMAMYGNSSRQAYWIARDIEARDTGMTEERWIDLGDSRVCDPCSEAGRMGWKPLGYFSQPGSGGVIRGATTCQGLSSCRCRKEYR